jgi:uncharacterized membrane protein YdjX (TVP38/TMEM64 family)
VAALTLILVAAVSSEQLHSWLVGVFDQARVLIARQPVVGAIVFVLLSALSAMLAFLSSAVLVPAALVTWGKTLTLLLLWLGWITGGAAAWTVARYFGRAVAARLTSAEALSRYEARLSRRSSFWFIVLFQLALPSEIPGYVLGLARCPLGRYLPAVALAELPFAIGAVYLGAGFLARQVVPLIVFGAAGLLLVAVAFHFLHARLVREE